ncbi:helical backbone metal receptor [Rapidithrix thailandica]|uniref:Helical backbone metal receptor n=1 Tax=Rapidithrix thailandica TaxID=413964 RepID=A0AAW9SEI5_9BACT
MAENKAIWKDQTGELVEIGSQPQRIISLVPSITELLIELGLEQQLVGITKFCIHPKEQLHNKVKIGGTKNFHFDKIHPLQPDLIIGNKEENYKEGILELRKQYPVWLSEVSDVPSALDMILSIGKITRTTSKAKSLTTEIQTNFKALEVLPKKKEGVLYFIWQTPFMIAGNDTYIHHILACAGMENLIRQPRYPVINIEEIKQLQPSKILLSSEPYPFREKHVKEFQRLFPDSQIILVDGTYFSWFGSRLKASPEYLQELIKA